MTALIFHKPDEPIDFLQSCLEEARKKKGHYTWNCFVESTTSSSRAVFSKSKPLPPIKESEGGANKNRKKHGEESSTAKLQENTHSANKSDSVQTAPEIQPQAKSLENKPLIFVLGRNRSLYINSFTINVYTCIYM